MLYGCCGYISFTSGMKWRYVSMETIRKSILGLLVLVVLISVLGLVWTISAAPEENMSTTTPRPLASPVQRLDLVRLQEANLFGRIVIVPPKQKQAKKAPIPSLVKSRLSVKVLGVVKGSEPDAAVAILQEGNRQRAYSIGDKLESNSRVKVVAIQADRVVLDQDGQRQYVELEPINATVWLAPAAPEVSSSAELPQRISLDRPNITSLIGKDLVSFVSDSSTFERFAQLQPNVVNGRLNGYRLLPGSDTRLFKQLGLKSGDLITHVAGIDISDPQNMPRLVALVQTERWIKVGISRGSLVKDIEVDLGAR